MKKDKLPKPITILILTLLTTLLWVGLSIYRTITVEPAASVPEDISASLNPTLNTEVIQKIESAAFTSDSEISQFNIIQVQSTTETVPTVTPLPTETPEATESAIATEQTGGESIEENTSEGLEEETL